MVGYLVVIYICAIFIIRRIVKRFDVEMMDAPLLMILWVLSPILIPISLVVAIVTFSAYVVAKYIFGVDGNFKDLGL